MQMTFDEAKKKICNLVVNEMDFTKEMSEEEVYKAIDDVMVKFPDRMEFSLPEVILLRSETFNSLRKYDAIQEFLEDSGVTEIMINGKDAVFIEKAGELIKTDKKFESKEKLEDVIQQMVSECNRTVNESSPIADARLKTGERVNIVLPPVALNGPIVTIRRFPDEAITMDKLESMRSISKEAADFLKNAVRAKYNIFISGGTGTGKTTFLNALSQYIPPNERIITIEDSAELNLINAENLVRLETRNKSVDGCTPISIRDLIRTALRMRPERIIVGETRGAEAVDMLQAMNTGHDGSLSTGHGNSPKDMIARLETMVLMGMNIPLPAIRGQISSAIELFVHLGRLRDRRRVVLEISEVMGMEDGEVKLAPLFEWDGREVKKVGCLSNDRKLRAYLDEL